MSADESDYSVNSDEVVKSLHYKNFVPKYQATGAELLTDPGTSIEVKLSGFSQFHCKFKATLNKMHSTPPPISLVREIDENYFNKLEGKRVKVHLALSRRSSRSN